MYFANRNNFFVGAAQLTLSDLEPALTFCNYIIYGYAKIDNNTFQVIPRLPDLEIANAHYTLITALKQQYPHLRILLSVGGDKDMDEDEQITNKYLNLLEDMESRHAFVESARSVAKTYGFDGIDLAWQFPKIPAKKIRGILGKIWHGAKSVIRMPFLARAIEESKAAEHKEQFTYLVRELSSTLRANDMKVSLTVLPNVNANLYIDINNVMPLVDFVNLATFDFQTPERDPKIADYPAPLYEAYRRKPENNVHYQVERWLNQSAPSDKIHLGVPAFGRAWIVSKNTGSTDIPPITKTKGAATATQGLLSWPEICEKLSAFKENAESETAIRKVPEPTRRYGSSAFHAADEQGLHGLWVGYEDPTTAAIKAEYAAAKHLGGVALFDLSHDDFKGTCAGEKYPILRSIKLKL